MIKFIGLVRHRDGVLRETLYGRWVTVHTPHIRRIARPLRYTLTFFDPGPDIEPGPAYDGIAEIWFRDRAHYDDTMGPNHPPDLGADGFSRFFDTAVYRQFLATEHCLVDGPAPPPATKRLAFLKRAPGVDRDAFMRRWLEDHGRAAAEQVRALPGALRYVLNLALDADAPFDGLAEIYFDSPESAALWRPLDNGFLALTDATATVRLQGREIVIVA